MSLVSVVRHCFLVEFEISKYSLLTQRSLFVIKVCLYQLQKEDKIPTIEEACIEPRKMLNILVCESTICQVCLVG